MIRNIFKSGAEKSKKDTPGVSDTNTEKPEAGNEEIIEEMTGTESKLDDDSKPEGNDDISKSEEDVEMEETIEPEVEASDEELAALHVKIAELKDKYLRLAAEYDNYRKRTLREKADLVQTAGQSLLKDILPVVDDFDRGIEAASNTEDMDAVRTGMELIYNKLKDFLTNNGVKEIDAMNEPFDTDWHEAVTNIPVSDEEKKGMIVDVIQKGYMLHNKVIRYPKVVVGE